MRALIALAIVCAAHAQTIAPAMRFEAESIRLSENTFGSRCRCWQQLWAAASQPGTLDGAGGSGDAGGGPDGH